MGFGCSGDFDVFAAEECVDHMAGSGEPAASFTMALGHSDRLCIHFKRYCTTVTLAGFSHFFYDLSSSLYTSQSWVTEGQSHPNQGAID